jgi:hypothetical protein
MSRHLVFLDEKGCIFFGGWQCGGMPQAQLPLFAEGMTQINEVIGVERREAKVYYFNGHLPVFVHEEADLRTFRFFTTQLIINGTVSQAQIARAFHVPPVTIKRYVKLYRERGAEGFFKPAKRREGRRLSEEVLRQAQEMLDEGLRVPQIAQRLEILATTLHKAIGDGRLRGGRDEKKDPPATLAGARAERRARASVR